MHPSGEGNSPSHRRVLSAVERARALGLNQDPQFAAALTFAALDPEDKHLWEFVQDRLSHAEMQSIIDPNPFRATNPVNKGCLPGTITLGLVPPAGIPWNIYPESLTCHLCILGRSGGGKTNFILLLLVQLLEMRRHA